MKKHVFFILFLSITFSVHSQKFNDCYINTKTHDTLLTTLWKNVIYENNLLLTYRFVKLNSQFFIDLKYNFGKGPEFSISKKDSILFKFENGLILELFSNEEVKSRRGYSAYPDNPKGLTVQGITVRFPLTFIQIMIFQTQKLDKIRIFTSLGNEIAVIPKSLKDNFMNDASQITMKILQYVVVSFNPKDEDLKSNKDNKLELTW